jgi:hypothetical protein
MLGNMFVSALLITILLSTLKALNIITWNWFWIFIPIYLFILLIIFMVDFNLDK